MTNLTLSCPHCGQRNRVPAARLGDHPRCGKCHQDGLLAAPVDLAPGDGDFEAVVREAGVPVLVDFWAPWCGPCRMVAPVLKEVAARHAADALVLKVNVDENPRASQQHGVQGIPTLVLFRGGVEAGRLVGAHPRGAIEGLLGRAQAARPN